MNMMLLAVIGAGAFLYMRSRKGKGNGAPPRDYSRPLTPEQSPGIEGYAQMLAIKRAVIDDASGVVTFQNDPRGPTFGSARDSQRFDNARGATHNLAGGPTPQLNQYGGYGASYGPHPTR